MADNDEIELLRAESRNKDMAIARLEHAVNRLAELLRRSHAREREILDEQEKALASVEKSMMEAMLRS